MADLLTAFDAVITRVSGDERGGQRSMVEAVGAALDRGDHLLVQAGTGTGKSLAYLVPAALHAVTTGQPVIIATATLALQRQLVERDLPAVCQAMEVLVGRPVTYAVLKGRANYICQQRLHGGSVDEPDETLPIGSGSKLEEEAKALREWALVTPTGDRDDYPQVVDARVWSALSVTRRECIGETRCTFGQECFAARARLEALEADVVVTNHALLAIDAIEGVPVLPEHSAVIVDEAHELVDRVTTAMSTTLSLALIDRMITRMRPFVPADHIERAMDAREAFQLSTSAQSGRLGEIPSDLRDALMMLQSAARLPTSSEPSPERQRAEGSVDEVAEATRAMLALDDHGVAWIDDVGRLHVAPLDVAASLQDRLFSRTTVVLTSATLSVGRGFSATLAALGLPDDTTAVDVGSPFDFQRQGILYVAADLPPPTREGVSDAALARLVSLIEAAGGRTLALFSSWSGVDRASAYLAEHLDASIPVHVQSRGESTAPLLAEFATDPRSCLIGTLGLWQGVDVPGEACVCVVIDRLPFPRPDDPLIAARQERVERSGGSGFRSVALPRAALLLAQGTGRLIRSAQDRGVVAVLDSRLANAGYGSVLRASLPPLWFTTDEADAIGALTRLDAEYLARAGAAR